MDTRALCCDETGCRFHRPMKLHGYFLLLAFASAALAAEPAIEFSGVLGSGHDTKVSLTNKATGQSRWVAVGEHFEDYVVSAYDANAEAVVLTKDGQQFRLRIKSAKVKEGAVEPSPEIKKAILNNLRQLAAAADQYYLENGKNKATLDELVGETKYVRKLVPVDGEDYRQIEFAQGKALRVTTQSGFSMSYEP